MAKGSALLESQEVRNLRIRELQSLNPAVSLSTLVLRGITRLEFLEGAEPASEPLPEPMLQAKMECAACPAVVELVCEALQSSGGGPAGWRGLPDVQLVCGLSAAHAGAYSQTSKARPS